MGILEAVKKGFVLSGKFMKVVLIFFILNVVMGLISLPLTRPENIGKAGIVVLSALLSIGFFLIVVFLQGGALGLVRDVYKSGAYEISNFAVYGKKYYLRILGLLGIYILIALALVLVLALIGSGILAINNNLFTRVLVSIVAGAVALVAIILLLFPIYSIVADEAGVIKSLKKGIEIGRNNFLNVLGLFLLLVLISVLIALIIGFIIGLITIRLPVTASQVIITIVNSCIQSYIAIVMMLALMGYCLGLAKKTRGPQDISP